MTTLKTGSARDRIKAYEAEMMAYALAHPEANRGVGQQSPNPWDMVGGTGSSSIQGPSEDYHTPEEDWVAALPPDVRADYLQAAKETQDANKRASQIKFAKMLAIAASAGAGGAALGLGDAAAGAGTIAGGAGDAGAGLGWMGGADATGVGTMGDAIAGGAGSATSGIGGGICLIRV